MTTDEDGVVNISEISEAKVALINTDDHVALGYLNTGSGVTPGEFGIWTNYYSSTSDLYAYLYTDRPLYRPGQEVFYKGILRFEDDLQYSLAGLNEVDIEITYQGDTIFTDTVPVNAIAPSAANLCWTKPLL